MTVLTRVTDSIDEANSGEWFRAADQDDAIRHRVYVGHAAWDAMGRPDTITQSLAAAGPAGAY